MNTPGLAFLKLGGSLITDKDTPRTPRREVIDRLAREIAEVRSTHPEIQILLGHGSGSFGHSAARKHGTRRGVQGQAGWLGFTEVWKEARALNNIVVEAMAQAGLPVIAFPPSAAVIARDGQVLRWELEPIQSALAAGSLPLINGDVIFDTIRGGTILSTEDLFFHLARLLRPKRILLAGIEDGVWADFPACTRLIPVITPATYAQAAGGIGGSASVDVTGGMNEKVRAMLELVKEVPDFEALIFSGRKEGAVYKALLGERLGTRICAQTGLTE